jgi:predicted secreted protein
MSRALTVVVVVLMMAFGATWANAQPRTGRNADKISQTVEGTIKSVRGTLITLEDGTELSVPATVKVSMAQLKPGAQIVAEYHERAGQKIAKSVDIKG